MKKSKLLTTAFASIGITGAIAPITALTSCGKKNEEVFETKYDEEYGVTEFAYNTLEQQFKQQVNAKIDRDDELSDYQKKLEKKMVLSDLDSFKNQISEISKNKTITKSKYTIVSNALIDHAQDEYGIRLNRNSKAQWSDIEQMYNGLKNSWKAYLQASGISGDKLASIMDDVETNYKKMTTSLTEKYVDPLSALFKAKYELPIVFASVNSDIAYLAASLVLKQFLAEYTIEFKQDGTNNKLDQLENQVVYDEELGKQVAFAEGNDITAFMNTAFTIRNAKTGQKVPEGFTRHIIPGYRISPIVTGIMHDEYENDHGVNISWECVKDTYKIGSDEAKKATVFAINQDSDKTFAYLDSVDEATLEGIQKANENDRLSIQYSIPLTADAQAKALKNTFKTTTDDKKTVGDIKLFWDANNENYIDALTLDSVEITPNIESEPTSRIYLCTGKALAKSGIKIAIGDTTDSTNIYSLNDLYENVGRANEKLESEGKSQLSIYDTLPTVLQGMCNGCDFVAKVTVDTIKNGNNETTYNVSISDTKLAYRNSDESSIDIAVDQPNNINWKTSKGFWEKATEKYNESRLLLKQYEDNVYEQDLEEMRSEKRLNDVFCGITIALDSLVMMAALLPTESIGQKVMKFVFLATSAIDMGLEIASYTIFRLHKWNIVSDYAERARNIKDTTEFKDFKQQLDTDKANHWLIDGAESTCNNNATFKLYIDQNLFDEYYDEYYSKDENYLEIQDNYIHSSYKNPVLQSFRTMLKTNQVDGESYARDMADWDPKTGKWEKISKDLMYASWAVFGAEILLMIFDSTIAAAVNTKYEPKLALKTTKQTSKGLVRRTIDTFKKLFKKADDPIRLVDKVELDTKYGWVVAEENVRTGISADKTLTNAVNKLPKVAETGGSYMKVSEEAEKLGFSGTYETAKQFLGTVEAMPCTLLCSGGKFVQNSTTKLAAVIKNALVGLAQKGFAIVYDTAEATYKFVKLAKKGSVLKELKEIGSIASLMEVEDLISGFTKAIDHFSEEARKIAKILVSDEKIGAKELRRYKDLFAEYMNASQMCCESVVDVLKNIIKGTNAYVQEAGSCIDFVRGLKLEA